MMTVNHNHYDADHSSLWPFSPFPVPEHIPAALHAFYGNYKSSFNHHFMEEAVKRYVSPNWAPYRDALVNSQNLLATRLEKFSESNAELTLLIHADTGAGKSLAVRVYEKKLWEDWRDVHDLIPLVIELKRIKVTTKNFLLEILTSETYGFTLKQVQFLQQKFNFLIILDGLDEFPTDFLKKLFSECDLSKWPNKKVVFTARTEWIFSQKDYRRLLKDVSHPEMQVCFIAEFSEDQIKEYCKKHFINSNKSWLEYYKVLDQDHDLKELARSPIMLHIICEILPTLEVELKESSSLHSRNWLYDKFLSAWLEREIEKTTLMNILEEKHDILAKKFLDYTQELAFTMFRENTDLIERIYQKKNNLLWHEISSDNPWIRFFDNAEPEFQKAQKSCPLILERFDYEENNVAMCRHRYQFIHKSIMEHAVANFMWKIFQEKSINETLALWNYRYITEQRGVLSFLIDLLMNSFNKNDDEIGLLNVVFSSKYRPENSKAASSAITLLNAVHFDFHNFVSDKDLSHINIQHADLTGAFMPYINLSNSDLSHVEFHNAVLVGVCFRHAILTNAHFLSGVNFLFSPVEIYALCCHPTQVNTIAYGESKYIVIRRFSEGNIDSRLTGHRSRVTSLAWSLKGGLASGSNDGTVRIWNLNSQAVSPCLKVLDEHEGSIDSVAWSLSGNLASGSRDGTVRIWNAGTLTCIKVLVQKTFVYSLGWSTDESKLASGNQYGVIYIWDMRDDVLVKSLPLVLNGHTKAIHGLSWSNDGKLASGSDDKTIRIWGVNSFSEPAESHILGKHEGSIQSIAWSPDGKLASSSDDNTIRIWEVDQLICHQTLTGHTKHVQCISWTADGKLVSGGSDKTMRVWNLSKSRERKHKIFLTGHADSIQNVAWSPDGKLASASRDGKICIWYVRNPFQTSCQKILNGHKYPVQSISWSNNETIISGSDDETIRIWNINNPLETECTKIFTGHSGFRSITFCFDKTFVSGSRDGKVRIWNMDLPSSSSPQKTLKGHENSIWSVACSADGKLASAGADRTIRIWNINFPADMTYPKILTGHTNSVECIAWSQCSMLLASGSWDSIVHIWDMNLPPESCCVGTLKGHASWVSSVVWSPNREWLISSGTAEILFWDTKNWGNQPIRFFFGATSLSLHGNLLAVAYEHTMQVLDLADFPGQMRWLMATPRILCLQSCDITGANISSTTKTFLIGKGACEDQENRMQVSNSDFKESTIENNPSTLIASFFSILFKKNLEILFNQHCNFILKSLSEKMLLEAKDVEQNTELDELSGELRMLIKKHQQESGEKLLITHDEENCRFSVSKNSIFVNRIETELILISREIDGGVGDFCKLS